jgi:energy-coupling factor transport system substrate-specific component
MRYTFSMWRNTRMIVLVAVTAAIYAAALIAFKTAVPLVPGITELRVAGVFLIVFGFLFGPAGAWGLAFGNLIGDVFGGTLTPASVFGFIGNFIQGYLVYTMWTHFVPFVPKTYEWKAKSARSWISYIVIALVSSASSAVIISAGVDALGVVPYAVLSKIITVNNVAGGLLGVILLIAVYGVTKGQFGLLWTDVMDVEQPPRRVWGCIGAWVVTLGAGLGLFCGMVPDLPVATLSWVSTAMIIAGCILL